MDHRSVQRIGTLTLRRRIARLVIVQIVDIAPRVRVRHWHIADVPLGFANVCFWGQSGYGPTDAYQTRFMSAWP